MNLSISKAWRRFRRREDGAATVEFCILFPAYLTVVLSAIESGMMMVRNVMLERGTDIAVRDLRLGMPSPPTYDEFKQTICDNAIIFQNCDDLIQVELQPVSTDTWAPLNGATACINESTHLREIDPDDPAADTVYEGSGNNQLMLVRVCGLFSPFFPSTRFVMQMPKYDPPEKEDATEDFVSQRYALVVTTAFVNEPSRQF
ncbi:MAG: TadE/TadG family type IV pilus assembly protein [Pseudomonadota bacterium]